MAYSGDSGLSDELAELARDADLSLRGDTARAEPRRAGRAGISPTRRTKRFRLLARSGSSSRTGRRNARTEPEFEQVHDGFKTEI